MRFTDYWRPLAVSSGSRQMGVHLGDPVAGAVTKLAFWLNGYNFS